MYKAKLLGSTVAQPTPNQANGILKNATIAMPLKNLSNFWRSLKMPVINWKIELKLKWPKYCTLYVNDNDVNDNDNASNSVFTIKDTKCSSCNNFRSKRQSKFIRTSEKLKDQFIGMNIKQKVRRKICQIEIFSKIKFFWLALIQAMLFTSMTAFG